MDYNKLCLMVPTYKRSTTSLPVFINSAIETAGDLKNICFCFCVNKKDTATKEYIEKYLWPAGVEWEIIEEKLIQPNLAAYFNMMYEKTRFNSSSVCVSMLGDDMEFVTKGWDVEFLRMINAYNGVGVFWANDDYIAHELLCVNLFVTRKFVEATRKPFMCDLYHADMIDAVWMEIGKLTHTSHYLEDVIIRHNHNTKKPGEQWDETFMRLRPIQQQANGRSNQRLGAIYAAIVAGTLINQGYGRWESRDRTVAK